MNEISGFAQRFKAGWNWLLRGEPFPLESGDDERLRNLPSVSVLKARYSAIWKKPLGAEGKDEFAIDNYITEMLYNRMHLCYYEESDYDIYCRKAFLVAYASQIISMRTLAYSILPAKSFLAADVDEIAIAYKVAPERWIESSIGETDEDRTSSLNKLYEEMHASAAFNEIFRRAYICNQVLVRPVISVDEKRIDYITPDNCIYTLDANDNVTEVAYPVIVNDKQAVKFWKSNGDNYYRSSDDGKIISEPKYDNIDLIPFVLMRVRKGKTTTYSEVEANLQANYAELQNLRNLTFNTSPIGKSVNFGLKDGQIINASEWLVAEGVQEGVTTPPSFEWAQPQLVLNEVQEYRRNLRVEAGANEGRPLSAFRDSAQVQSGISRQLEREVLYNKRETHLEYLRVFEWRFYVMLIRILEAANIKENFDESFLLNVDFAELSEPDDPQKEFDLLIAKAEKNIITYAEIFKRYNTDVDSYEEAQDRLLENKKQNDALKSRGLFASLLEKEKETEQANRNQLQAITDITKKITG